MVGGRVLVVDDDQAILQMVSKMVEVLGFEVASTADSAEALRRLRSEAFDLVISDLMMPGIDGRELLETIKAQKIDVGVLFISAAGTIPQVVELMKLGAIGFIEKPFTASSLRKEVFEAFRGRAASPKPDTLSASRPPTDLGAHPSVSVDLDLEDKPTGRHSSLQLGRYQIRILLGVGGMGSVYRAYDTALDREVALKVIRLPPDPDRQEDSLKRFTSEARAAAALSHPGIVSVYDFGEDTKRNIHYIVMELVRGVSLRETVRALAPLPLAKALSIIYQLADALAFAHRHGVVHRDVKPENVLLVGDRAKLLDFGVAKVDGVHITKDARMVGSPTYLSPEGARGERVDGRADQFALATLLIEMLTGKRIFEADSIIATARRVCDLATPRLKDLGTSVPDRVERLVERMHAKDRAARFSDEELLEELRRIGEELGVALE
ncbi:MAG: response regulator [Deltaproteobacteria bacterium]|nr:response regulator [Deltaproteobacteria bacterium]